MVGGGGGQQGGGREGKRGVGEGRKSGKKSHGCEGGGMPRVSWGMKICRRGWESIG